jgi:hypothetical protein
MADGRGGKSTLLTHVTVDDTLTIANAYAAVQTFATLAETVSDAQIEHGTFSLINYAVAAAGAADADVAAGAVFDFANAADATVYGQYVPSFLDSLIDAGGHINIGAGAPQAYVAALVGAVLGGRYTNPRFIANSAGLDAFLSNRKRRKRVR